MSYARMGFKTRASLSVHGFRCCQGKSGCARLRGDANISRSRACGSLGLSGCAAMCAIPDHGHRGAGQKRSRRFCCCTRTSVPCSAEDVGVVPVWSRAFSISAGQQVVWITLGEKWQLLVRSRGRGPYSEPLQSSTGNQSTGMRVVVGPYPGFRVSLWFRLVGMWGAAASDHEGEPRPHWPWALWLTTVTSLAVGLECVVLILWGSNTRCSALTCGPRVPVGHG
jgi:hypothetical protein